MELGKTILIINIAFQSLIHGYPHTSKSHESVKKSTLHGVDFRQKCKNGHCIGNRCI